MKKTDNRKSGAYSDPGMATPVLQDVRRPDRGAGCSRAAWQLALSDSDWQPPNSHEHITQQLVENQIWKTTIFLKPNQLEEQIGSPTSIRAEMWEPNPETHLT